jgi:hypothetical protein
MCDAPATGREHAPPKCFFPEFKDVGVDLRRNLITVPSCDAHNSERSRDDQYAMVVAVAHVDTNAVARSQFSTKVIRTLQRSPAFTRSIFKESKPLYVEGKPTIAVDVDLNRFNRVMEHTCRALAFDLGCRLPGHIEVWSTAFHFHTDLTKSPGYEQFAFQTRRILRGSARLGANPDVFWYQLKEEQGIAMRLQFYGGFSVYALAG